MNGIHHATGVALRLVGGRLMKPIRPRGVKAGAKPRPSRALGALHVCARLVHSDTHAFDGAVEAAEDRLADQKMPDVQLDDGWDRRDGAHRLVAEAVTRMAF